MDPTYELPHLLLGRAYQQKGDFARAIPEFQRAVELSHNTPLMVSALARANALSGNREQAEKLLAELVAKSNREYVSPFYIAMINAGLGRTTVAMDWLEKAYSDRSNGLVFLKVDPELDSLRANPRFIELQRKLSYPE
jgi:Flp pilus assembly protein TadD